MMTIIFGTILSSIELRNYFNSQIMKKLIAIMFVAVIMSSCGNKAKEEAAAKAQQQAAIKAVKDSIRIDSFKRADVAKKEKLAQQAEEKRVMMLAEERRAAAAPAVTSHSTSSSSTTTTSTKKKGWSQAAKGTAIGAGAGALGGVLVDKNNTRGAIVGGVVGAGAGYLIGHKQDKKSGRAN
jgi:cobalamin biosynthesis Mg chelatase CobN